MRGAAAPAIREAEPAAAPAPVIDLAELAAVRGILTEAGFAEFIEACLLQAAKHRKELASRRCDAGRLAHLAHAMVGSAGAMGALRAAEAARRLEEACDGDDEDLRSRSIAEMVAAWSEVDRELKRIQATRH